MMTYTKEYNDSCEKLENTFKSLNINFKKIYLEDDDINYIINFQTSNAPLISIQSLKNVEGLVFIDHADNSLNFMVINIFAIRKKQNLEFYYELVNDVNGIINHGKFILHKDTYRIIYRAVVDYDKEYDIFSNELFKSIIDDFLKNLSVFFVIMKKKGVNNNG